MKKVLAGISLFALALGILPIGRIQNAEASAVFTTDIVFSDAKYISVENAPIIDGVKDDVWINAAVLKTDSTMESVSNDVSLENNESQGQAKMKVSCSSTITTLPLFMIFFSAFHLVLRKSNSNKRRD